MGADLQEWGFGYKAGYFSAGSRKAGSALRIWISGSVTDMDGGFPEKGCLWYRWVSEQDRVRKEAYRRFVWFLLNKNTEKEVAVAGGLFPN